MISIILICKVLSLKASTNHHESSLYNINYSPANTFSYRSKDVAMIFIHPRAQHPCSYDIALRNFSLAQLSFSNTTTTNMRDIDNVLRFQGRHAHRHRCCRSFGRTVELESFALAECAFHPPPTPTQLLASC